MTRAVRQRVIGCVYSPSRDNRRSDAAAGESVRVGGKSATDLRSGVEAVSLRHEM